MGDDLLTHDERLRLEALAQAVAFSATHPTRDGNTPEGVVKTARTFETMIRTNREGG